MCVRDALPRNDERGESEEKEALHLLDARPDVAVALDAQVLEARHLELVLAQSLAAPRDGAGSGPGGEDALDAGVAHLVVALRVDHEDHALVQVGRRLADGAHVVCRGC